MSISSSKRNTPLSTPRQRIDLSVDSHCSNTQYQSYIFKIVKIKIEILTKNQ